MTKRPSRAPPADILLDWYARNRRRLPWRAASGETPDPYRVWLSEIMLQQTTVKTVAPYFQKFVARWPDVAALAAAPLDDVLRMWAGLGYYARARNLHACAQAIVQAHAGRFPESEAELRKLPGVGEYTAAAVAAIAFGRRAIPVDGNIERVIARLFAVAEPPSAARPRIRARAAQLVPERRAGDFAQAMMDLGATICTPKRPACARCPWNDACAAHRSGAAESFPRQAAKRDAPMRHGAAFWLVRADERVLLRTRPPHGLLGGMTELPGAGWSCDFDPATALAAAPIVRASGQAIDLRWRRLPGIVTHRFTHFPLQLTVFAGEAPRHAEAPVGARWISLAQLADEALPKVMQKAIAHALARSRDAPRDERR